MKLLAAAPGAQWPSALTLLYPVGAAIWIASYTPPPASAIVGYGVANLGYALFAAGILRGTFRVFGLRTRWRVIVLAGSLLLRRNYSD